MSSARLARIGQVLDKDVAGGRMPGAVVAIARRGKLIYFEAFGFLDRQAGTRMPKDALFSIASMTKPLTGVATMILQEEGKLHLAEPASRYLPALGKLRVAADPTVTDAAAVQDGAVALPDQHPGSDAPHGGHGLRLGGNQRRVQAVAGLGGGVRPRVRRSRRSWPSWRRCR